MLKNGLPFFLYLSDFRSRDELWTFKEFEILYFRITGFHLWFFLLTDERFRLVWLVANCISVFERNDILPDETFTKHWKTMK